MEAMKDNKEFNAVKSMSKGTMSETEKKHVTLWAGTQKPEQTGDKMAKGKDAEQLMTHAKMIKKGRWQQKSLMWYDQKFSISTAPDH